ncbi:hypothetical protein GTO89_12835 [Heliobacterium gestii]|uniref:Histidine phosphatase family protein n=1 Tax=Heliomicrobium gestii TaxID=2699 RepID=A0A845LM18_HELGE|nr:histidine phosphatase family protein [Heliomicrobium gestii]MBM7867536.1 broad specificity phosphatase PhoE [Heliomicrobium gestii]MZP43916.1 hypothetical protein [Heliomicrobium gestii]
MGFLNDKMESVNMQIIFVRHGQTDENIIPLGARFTIDTFNAMMSGSPSMVRLNTTGIGQVEAVARRLRPVPVVVASHFQRAQETATILARAWGAEVVTMESLGEIVLSKFPGSGNRRAIPFCLLIAMTVWRHAWPFTQGEETLYQAFRRARLAWTQLLDVARERGSIVVISHQGFLRILLWYLRLKRGCRVRKKDLGNGGISIVEVGEPAEMTGRHRAYGAGRTETTRAARVVLPQEGEGRDEPAPVAGSAAIASGGAAAVLLEGVACMEGVSAKRIAAKRALLRRDRR